MKIRTITQEDLNLLCFNERVAERISKKPNPSAWLKDSLSENVNFVINNGIGELIKRQNPTDIGADNHPSYSINYTLEANLYQAGQIHSYIKSVGASVYSMRKAFGDYFFEGINKILKTEDMQELLSMPFKFTRNIDSKEFHFENFGQLIGSDLSSGHGVIKSLKDILGGVHQNADMVLLERKSERTRQEETRYIKLTEEHQLELAVKSRYVYSELAGIESFGDDDIRLKSMALKLILLEHDKHDFPVVSTELKNILIDEIGSSKYSQLDFDKMATYLDGHFPNNKIGLTILTHHKIKEAFDDIVLKNVDICDSQESESSQRFKL